MTLAILFESVGFGEWFVLLAVILIVVGPKRLPSTARKVGQYYAKFRRAADGFKRQLLEMDTQIDTAVARAEQEANETFDSADYGSMYGVHTPEDELKDETPAEKPVEALAEKPAEKSDVPPMMED